MTAGAASSSARKMSEANRMDVNVFTIKFCLVFERRGNVVEPADRRIGGDVGVGVIGARGIGSRGKRRHLIGQVINPDRKLESIDAAQETMGLPFFRRVR